MSIKLNRINALFFCDPLTLNKRVASPSPRISDRETDPFPIARTRYPPICLALSLMDGQ
ncbi:MAG: hypothetical protein RL145_999 [Pseudomonadota bacterium]